MENVILTGIHKLAMRGLFNNYEFLMSEMKMHLNPVDKEKFEMVRFQVENNLPINKALLFQVAPDFFEMELEQLEEAERRKILNGKIKFLEV